MESYASGHAAVIKRLYDRVLYKREPCALRGWIARGEEHKQLIYRESVFMPLGETDVIDHIFNVSVYVSHGTIPS